MSAPVVPILGVDINARDVIVQVDLNNNPLSPNWAGGTVGGVQSFVATTDSPTTADGRRFSDGGYGRTPKTGTDWSAVMTCATAPLAADSTQRDVAQEYLRAHGEGQIGSGAEVWLRWFEYHDDLTLPFVKAYVGQATVSYNEPNGGGTDIAIATYTFTGQGKLQKPAHPYPATPVVPNITSVVPRNVGTAGGSLVKVYGDHFSNVTGITIGGTNVPVYSIDSDSQITLVTIAKTAGNQALVVTNTTGASTTGGNLVYA